MSTTDRKKLIDQSVRFLQHPTVRDTPLSEKLKFLEKKGLTSQVMFRTWTDCADVWSHCAAGNHKSFEGVWRSRLQPDKSDCFIDGIERDFYMGYKQYFELCANVDWSNERFSTARSSWRHCWRPFGIRVPCVASIISRRSKTLRCGPSFQESYRETTRNRLEDLLWRILRLGFFRYIIQNHRQRVWSNWFYCQLYTNTKHSNSQTRWPKYYDTRQSFRKSSARNVLKLQTSHSSNADATEREHLRSNS